MLTAQDIDLGSASISPDGNVTIKRIGAGTGTDELELTDEVAGTITLAAAANALSTHTSDTTAIHGITDTSDLALKSGGLDEFTEVVITAVADNEVLAFNTGTSKWINQTAAEAGLATAAHTIVSHDTDATGAELTTLTDGSNGDALHVHAGSVATTGDTMTGALVFSGLSVATAIDMTADGIAGALEFHIEIGGNDFWRGDGNLSISGDFTMLVGTQAGIGTGSPDGTLHVHTNTAGAVTADASADDLVVENNAAGGMTILTPATATGIYGFGSPTAADRASMRYDHNTDVMEFYTSATLALSIDGNQDLTLAGSMALVSGEVITAETIQAVDATGLQLFEDSGLGLTVLDGSGNVNFDGDINVGGGNINHGGTLDIDANAGALILDGRDGIFCDAQTSDFGWRDSADGNAERMRLFRATGELKLLDSVTAGDGGYLTMFERGPAPTPAAHTASIWVSDGTIVGAKGSLMFTTNNNISTVTKEVATHA